MKILTLFKMYKANFDQFYKIDFLSVPCLSFMINKVLEIFMLVLILYPFIWYSFGIFRYDSIEYSGSKGNRTSSAAGASASERSRGRTLQIKDIYVKFEMT